MATSSRPASGSAAPPGAAPGRGVSFEAALRDAASIARLSPSSHNCQPWALAHAATPAARRSAAAGLGAADDGGGEYLVLALDRDRSLGALPAHELEMQLSCGAYGRLLLRALAAHGWTAARVRLGEEMVEQVPVPTGWTPLGVVELRPGAGPDAAALDGLRYVAERRRTNRAPYRPGPVDAALLKDLAQPRDLAQPQEEARPTDGTLGTRPAVRHLVADAERAAFATLLSRHGGRDFSHPAAWRETHSHIRRDEAAAHAVGDGFSLAQLFGPLPPLRRRLMRIALAPLTMRVLSRVGYHRLLARRLAMVVRRSPVLLMMTLPDERPGRAAVLRSGGYLLDYWLRATRAGLVVHPVSVLLQHDDLRWELQRRLGLAGRVVFAGRLGHPTADFPAAPRRGADASFQSL